MPKILKFKSGRLLTGSCLDRLKDLKDDSIDSVVTDPPYGINFMGKAWDGEAIAKAAKQEPKDHTKTTERSASMHAGKYDLSLTANQSFQVWCESWAAECLRILKPGGHLLAFGSTRTYHRMVCAIEDAGFEVRDSIHWTYGSGFPKSLDVSKAIDKAAGAERKVVKTVKKTPSAGGAHTNEGWVRPWADGKTTMDLTAPATDAAAKWQGWGTALKPSHELIVIARKPLDGTVAVNVLEHGTGALNIDGCRIGTEGGTAQSGPVRPGKDSDKYGRGMGGSCDIMPLNAGRWPANVVLTHAADCGSDCAPGCPVAALDQQSGVSKSQGGRIGKKAQGTVAIGGAGTYEAGDPGFGDTGGASRFFAVTEWEPVWDDPFLYVPKPSKKERNAGLDKLRDNPSPGVYAGRRDGTLDGKPTAPRANHHPTVKPVALMRHLVRLVTPPGGTVLDPFLGSGTTAIAAILEGFNWVGCEMTDDYLPIIKGRVKHAQKQADKQQPELPLTEQPAATDASGYAEPPREHATDHAKRPQ